MGRPYPEVGGDDVLVGSVVADRYHVAGVLGHGCTGTVFGVEHIHFGRRGAMKVLRPPHTSADLVHRVFNGDARAAWSVNHPCLLEVFDVGTLPDGAPFFVTEYLEGETLAKRMARDRLSLAAAVDVMMQLLSAVAAVHERALLVRDLRPQNVFLAHRRGCRPIAKVLDLGLARLTPLDMIAEQWEADPTSAQQSYPQPFYLSPERTRSEHGIEPASDLFVAGVLFYEMLTGTRPFVSSAYNGLLLKIAQADPPAVSELRDHSLTDLDAFVSRSIAGNPRGRFASAKEMQDELRRIFESSKRSSPASTVIQAANTSPPSGSNMEGSGPHAPPAADHDVYTEDSETDRGFFDRSPFRERAPTPSEHDLHSAPTNIAAHLAALPVVDEDDDSAEDTVRPQSGHNKLVELETVQAFMPAPPEGVTSPGSSAIANAIASAIAIDSDEEEERTESRNAILDPVLRDIREANKTPLPPVAEEETLQLQMTPEMRAKIEAQYEASRPRPPLESEMDSIPPPTKRLDNK